MVFIGPPEELESGVPAPFVVMDWGSKKLHRLCQSSLAAEAQAAALGVDPLTWVKIDLILSLRLDVPGEGTLRCST